MATKFDFSALHKSFKPILRDQEVWLIVSIAIGFSADAAAEGNTSLLRVLTILVAFWLLIAHIRRKLELHKEKKVPFLVVVGKSDAQHRDIRQQVEAALAENRINLQSLKRAYGLVSDDWIFHQEAPLPGEPEAWRRLIHKLEDKFWRLAERIPGRKVYQIFLAGPSTLALALGATIGSRSEYVFYHYMAGSGNNPYHRVIDFSREEFREGSHILKTAVPEYRLIRVRGLEKLGRTRKREALAAIHLAAHNPSGDVEKRARAEGRPAIFIDSDFGGTIPLEQDWVALSREISSVILQASARANIDRLHLFLSLPLPIAFALGSALGKFVRATVYNYFTPPGEYAGVFRLEEC